MEMLKQVDENNEIIGEISFQKAHKETILHRVAHIWILTKDNKVIIQHRSKDKKRLPDLDDISAAGHVEWGEDEEDGAKRETFEELGIQLEELGEPTIFRGKVFDGGKMVENEFQYLYFVKANILEEDIRIDGDEVDSVHTLSLEEFKEDYFKNRDKYVAHGDKYFNLVFRKLGELV